jgi:four helix bundle suffix protein
MELKLTNVARASLEELKLDYEDFLRQRGLALWERQDPRRNELIALRPTTADEVAHWAKKTHGQSGPSGRKAQKTNPPKPSTTSTVSTQSTYPEIAANGALALIDVAVALLNRQIAAQAKAFETEGGFTERLYRTRTTRRRGR